MKYKRATVVLLLLLAFSSISRAFPFSKAEDSNVLFFDDFEQTQINPSKWAVQENTNMSGYPAYGGSVQVSYGHISLSSNGSTFPWVYTAINPFPASSDFSVEFNLTYTCISDWGDGVRVFGDSPTADSSVWKNNIFTLWAHDEGETTGVILIEMFDNRVYSNYVPGFRPSSSAHNYKLEYLNGNYTVYVDNLAVVSLQSSLRPSAIGLGHPPTKNLPNSPESTQRWAYWGWSAFNLDSIKVQKVTDNNANTSLKETNIGLSVSAQTQQIGLEIGFSSKLENAEAQAISGESILFSYNIPGTSTWYPITAATTDAQGQCNVSWIPTATGTFTVKAEYFGNPVYAAAYDAKNVSLLERNEKSSFLVESNSTLSALFFNSTSNQISFNVSGASGTTGYVKCIIPKALLQNVSLLEVYLDNKQVEYSATPNDDGSWVIYLTYSHSTHNIAFDVQAMKETEPAWLVAVALAAIFTVIAISIAVYVKKNFN